MIKNILFDFGDVFINLDKSAVPTGIISYEKSPEDPTLSTLAERYEKGMITSDEFIATACTILGEDNPNYIIDLWNSMITDFPEERLEFIENLKAVKSHRLFLLSNTNALHIKYVEEIMGKSKYQRFRNCFEGFYLSHEMGMRKPEVEIFKFILNSHGLEAKETLFIDDTLEHILSAGTLGINTWHLQVGQETVQKLLERLK
ncbi:HAD family phosphatase [Robiginitalea sp.]|jgi:putative hydrolase of the HAD superfamily|nr:HAD family phosphatase [Robiginitalea sp.]